MTETELEYHFCFNCNERKQCYTKPKDCTRIKEEIGLQSNIEWMREASLEELAGTIYEWHSAGYTKGRLGLGLNPITDIVEWLKQPHGGES